MRRKLHFDFPAKVENVLKVREATNKFCQDMGFSKFTTSLIATAVWEAALNAATHGSPNGEDDRVEVKMTAVDNMLQVDITSQNRSFELPKGKPVLDPSSRRGRGLPIIYAVMDKVWLTKNSKGATLHMTKELTTDDGLKIPSKGTESSCKSETGCSTQNDATMSLYSAFCT